MTGGYAGGPGQHLDYDTTQEHAAPNTFSDLAFRGVLAAGATAVWRGMIRVDPGAQRTDAFQESRNLLLSPEAHADAIPGLEIEADDVRCTHAAAIAQIDRDQLFYLTSRGLDAGRGEAADHRGLPRVAGRAPGRGPGARRGLRRARAAASPRSSSGAASVATTLGPPAWLRCAGGPSAHWDEARSGRLIRNLYTSEPSSRRREHR